MALGHKLLVARALLARTNWLAGGFGPDNLETFQNRQVSLEEVTYEKRLDSSEERERARAAINAN